MLTSCQLCVEFQHEVPGAGPVVPYSYTSIFSEPQCLCFDTGASFALGKSFNVCLGWLGLDRMIKPKLDSYQRSVDVSFNLG